MENNRRLIYVVCSACGRTVPSFDGVVLRHLESDDSVKMQLCILGEKNNEKISNE